MIGADLELYRCQDRLTWLAEQSGDKDGPLVRRTLLGQRYQAFSDLIGGNGLQACIWRNGNDIQCIGAKRLNEA
jgi:hypothetical protein